VRYGVALQKINDVRNWVTEEVPCNGEFHTVHWSPVAGGRLILDNHPMETEEDQQITKALMSLDEQAMPYCLYLYKRFLENNLYYDSMMPPPKGAPKGAKGGFYHFGRR